MPRNNGKVVRTEKLDSGTPRAEAEAILKHYLNRLRDGEDITGLVILAEVEGHTFECKMTSTDNPATRLGRAGFLYDAILQESIDV